MSKTEKIIFIIAVAFILIGAGYLMYRAWKYGEPLPQLL